MTYAASAPALSTPAKKGKCFSCGKQGHWASECHSKMSTGFSQPNPNTSRLVSVCDQQGYADIVCQCGAGVCESRVAKKSGKEYYTCPAESWKRCGFFMWRHELESKSVKRMEFPICECGAGVCVLGRDAVTGREYFRCRVPKGHGACLFRQWLDVPVSLSYTKSALVEESYQLSTPQKLGKQANHPLFEEDDSRRKCLRITELDASPNTSGGLLSSNSTASLLILSTKEGSDMSTMELDDISPELLKEIMEYDYPLAEDDELSCKRLKTPESEENTVSASAQLTPNSVISFEFSNGKEFPTEFAVDLNQFETDDNFINEVIAFESTISNVDERVDISCDSPMEEVIETETDSAKLQKQNIDKLRQAKFVRRLDAAATEIPKEKCLSVMLGAQYLGWLCRLAFASPRCMILPLEKSWFCCIFPNFDPIHVPRGLGQFHGDTKTVSDSVVDKYHTVPQENVVEDVPAIILKEPSALESPSYVADPDNVVAATIMEAFEKAAMLIQTNFITRLESMNLSSHESMVKEANTVFASLDHLKVDYRQFHLRVKNFIDAAALLNQIKLSVCNDSLFQDTLDRCKLEKLRLEQLSSEHSSIMDSFTRSCERVQSLLNEAKEVRNRLLQIEQQVNECQLETDNLNTRLTELSDKINECEINLQCASHEAEAARKLSLHKEAELSAAWDAFEKAKFQLRNTDRDRNKSS